jgi:hypothetical protein
MENQIQRREFLRKAAMFTAAAIAFPGSLSAGSFPDETASTGNPLLNPAFRIKELNHGEIELYTYLKDKSKLSDIFAGFDADLLKCIAEGKVPGQEIPVLSYRYNLTEDECWRRTKELLMDLQHSGIIYYGKLMLVKIQEG